MGWKMAGGCLWWMLLGAGVESGDTALYGGTTTTDTTITDTTTDTTGTATDVTGTDTVTDVTGTDTVTDTTGTDTTLTTTGTDTSGDADTDTDSDTDTDTDTDTDADTDTGTGTGTDTGTGTTTGGSGLSCPDCKTASKLVGDPGGSPCDDGCSTGGSLGAVSWLPLLLLWRRRS